MELPIPLIADRWWITEQRIAPQLQLASQGAVRELSWRQIEDPPPLSPAQKEHYAALVQVPKTKGAWFLVELDKDHTLAEYHSEIDPGGYLPEGPTSSLAVLGLEQTFTAMEHYARKPAPGSCQMLKPD